MQTMSAGDMVVLPRPHFQLRDSGLYFLLSTRPLAELDANDAALWAMLDGAATVGQLEQRQPGAKERLQRLWALGACEFAAADFPANRKRILVIEPHMDDAILSVGGLMWSLRESCEFMLVTVGGRSNFTSYYMLERDFFDVQRVSALRKAESALVMRLLGGHHADLGLPDAPLRYHDGSWTLDWFKQHRRVISASIGCTPSALQVDAWTGAIQRAVAQAEAEEIWMPLGIGGHADHEMTRNACLRALARIPGIADQCQIFLYQDVPYASRFPWHTPQVLRALTEAGAALEPRLENIADAFEAKLRLLAIFGSQFKMSYMAPRVEEAARMASVSGEGRSEILFRLARMPGAVDSFAVYSARGTVEEIANRLAPWLRRHQSTQRLRILTPVPVGSWADDLSLLLEVFPRATIEVHVAKKNRAETDSLTSPRIEVHSVEGSAAAWMLRLLRHMFERSSPLIVFTGVGRPAVSRLMAVVCAVFDTLAATTMTHLVMAIKRVK